MLIRRPPKVVARNRVTSFVSMLMSVDRRAQMNRKKAVSKEAISNAKKARKSSGLNYSQGPCEPFLFFMIKKYTMDHDMSQYK